MRTGIGRFTGELLGHLAGREEVDITAYAVTWRGHADLADLVPTGVRAARRRMAASPLRWCWSHADHPRIERWTGPVDIVHGPNFVVPPARATRVMSVHDLTFLHFPEYCTPAVLEYPALLRRAVRTGAWIHTDSDFVRDEVIALLDADPERVVTVPLGITAPTSDDAARGRRLAGTDRYLLALGTVEPRKNLPMLVEAFDDLAASRPELRLVLAGPDGWGTEAVAAAVTRARHGDRVLRLGFVSETDRGDLLAGASAVVVPSHYEGFGFAAAEAMRAGIPVVASAAGSHQEVVGDAGLLVGDLTNDGLGAAIAEVLDDETTAARLRAAGPARVAPLTWERTAAGIVGLWTRALSLS